MWNFQSWGIFSLDVVSTAHVCPKQIFLFLENVTVMINW